MNPTDLQYALRNKKSKSIRNSELDKIMYWESFENKDLKKFKNIDNVCKQV